MRIILKIVASTIAVLLIALGGATWWAYSAVTQTPEFYTETMEADPDTQAEDSQTLESRVSVLVSDVQKPGKWQSTISADEMNGWLAVKLPESYPDLLPKEIQDPRVNIEPRNFRLAVKHNLGSVETVVTLTLDTYVTTENMLAVEIKSAHAGTFPLPPAQIAEGLRDSMQKTDLPVRWSMTEGRHVMLVDIDQWGTAEDETHTLEKVELVDGALFLSGMTQAVGGDAAQPLCEEPKE